MTLSDLEQLFDLERVGKSGVKFDEKKLEYLNQMHIRFKFQYFEDPREKQLCLEEWRQVMLETLPSSFHRQIKGLSDLNVCRIMDMMKVRIHFYKDLLKHTYFFQQPDYSSETAAKFSKKLKQPSSVKVQILTDLVGIFKSMQKQAPSSDFVDATAMNKACSAYLFEHRERGWKSDDVFFLLRFALTGNPVGAPTAEISQVIGME
jgi:glutamyl/glutaminyl-tRNA synthetase